jgi:hypothetical protein
MKIISVEVGQHDSRIEILNSCIENRPYLETIRPLLVKSFSLLIPAEKIQQCALTGEYFDAVVLGDLSVAEKPQINFAYGYRTPSFRLLANFDRWVTHPATFIRIANFWRFARYINMPIIENWLSTWMPNKDNLEDFIWGNWLLFNRISFVDYENSSLFVR